MHDVTCRYFSHFVADFLGAAIQLFGRGCWCDESCFFRCVSAWGMLTNNCVELELCLPIMVSYLLFTSTGFFAWSQSSYAQDPWPVPIIVCLGLINFGVQLATTGVVRYVVECDREKAGESFAAMNLIKNLFAFGLSFYINDWTDQQGVRDCFFTIGGITMSVTLLIIPM